MKIYELAGRVAHRVATPLLLLAGTQHKTRVRTFVLSEHNNLLLVRSWFGYQKWSLPGGGIKKGETAARAVVRETFEETGILLPTDSIRPIGTFTNTDSAVPFVVDCQLAVNVEEKPPHIILYRRFEILEAAWFPIDRLPEPHSPIVDKALTTLTKLR